MNGSLWELPRDITRPLWIGGIAVFVFLSLVIGWSVLAPISTSLQMPGKVLSSSPAIDLQHAYGGQISGVLVKKHQKVTRNQKLMQLDDTLTRAQRESLRSERDRVAGQNRAITALLAVNPDIETIMRHGEATEYALRYMRLQQQSELQQQAAQNLGSQIQALEQKIGYFQQQLESMSGRAERTVVLREKGVVSRISGETLEEQVLIVAGEIAGEQAELHRLQEERRRTQEMAAIGRLSLREELITRKRDNRFRIEDLDRQIAGLDDQIRRSKILSPVDGIVTDIPYEANGMYAPRGATLMSISTPLDRPQILFTIPTRLIDQVRPGMTGQLVIPSFPQRSMPRIEVVIRSVSPRATTDEAESSPSYEGIAEFEWNPETYGLEGLELTADMPVVLWIEGRQTTLADYLIAPFWKAFNLALQD